MRFSTRKWTLFFTLALLFIFNYGTALAADAILTWDPNSENDLAGYKVYVGSASHGYGTPVDVGNVTTWTVTGLAEGTTYYFAVTAYNTAGVESAFSNEVNKTFVAAPDRTPPAISSVNAAGIGMNGATITWATNEPADSQVQYGTTTAYGASTPLNAAMATAHSVSLTGLQPATVYHYRVLSRDAAGNAATSADNTFTTSDTASPSVPTALKATAVSVSQIDLSWSASTDNVGVAGYRIYRQGVQIGTSVTPSYSDTGLSPSSPYSYTVSAVDAAGNASAQSAAASATTLTPTGGSTLTLSPTADTFLKIDNTANSTAPTLNTYTWPAQKVANAILMKFDLSGLPSGAVIQSATLNLSLVESDNLSAPTYAITAHKLINKNPDLTRATGNSYDGVNPWTANACCYQGIPLAQADISPVYDTQAVDKSLGVKRWNLTKMVQEWMAAPAANFGLMLNSDATMPADAYRLFASMEEPNISLRPSLTITYAAQTDTVPPSASLEAPLSGALVKGTISVQGTVSDNQEVVKVEYLLDGTVQTTQEGTRLGSVSWSWNTALTADGAHPLLLRAYDTAGLSADSQTITVTVDNTPPSAPGTPTASSVQQTEVSFSWPAATDANALAGYQVSRNGTVLGTTSTLSYTDTGLAPNSRYTYTVVATDRAGNASPPSPPLTVTTLSAAPVLSGISAGNITATEATINWTTDKPADSQVQYGTTTAYGASPPLNAAMATAHSVSLTGLQPATVYHYRVLSRDAAGNLTTSGDNTFTTTSDTAPPSVPTALKATAVSVSQIDLSWSASTDNVGVAGYRIYRQGVQIGTSVTPSYSDTGLSPSSPYSYTVSAVDAAGNASAQSAAASATTLTPTGGSTLTLSPTADTFLKIDNTANSTAPTLNTYTWPAQKVANAILMKFDLSGLPSGAAIQSATLNLSLVESDNLSAPTYAITAHKLINKNPDLTRATGNSYDGVNPWTANACCYQGIPLAQADISPVYDTQAVDKSLGVKRWNLTKMVQEWMAAPAANFGLMLNSDATMPADAYRLFASMEEPNISLRPSLTITYTLPATTASAQRTEPSAGPALSAPTVSNITPTAATITWNTDVPATTRIEFGQTTSYGRATIFDPTPRTSHSQRITGLLRNTLYHFRVRSKDAQGNLSISEDGVFRTAP